MTIRMINWSSIVNHQSFVPLGLGPLQTLLILHHIQSSSNQGGGVRSESIWSYVSVIEESVSTITRGMKPTATVVSFVIPTHEQTFGISQWFLHNLQMALSICHVIIWIWWEYRMGQTLIIVSIDTSGGWCESLCYHHKNITFFWIQAFRYDLSSVYLFWNCSVSL